MRIGTKEFDMVKNTYIMGILNVTPDSFSDGGKFCSTELALQHGARMVEEGAAVIDVGGESTRPGHVQISVDEEIERIVPVIECLKKHLDVPISIDTYKSQVAQAALEAGADLVNDIWGLKYDDKMAEVIARYDVPCVLMHNRDNMNYDHFLEDLLQDLQETITIAQNAGIAREKIILDPGIGFAKNQEMNLKVLNHLSLFHQLGYPMLLAASRKSVIGNVLNLPVEQRVEGTLVTTQMAVMNDYGMVRVHDIKENARVIQMTRAIRNA